MILHSSGNALFRYPKLPSTHTTCGQLLTLLMHASLTMMPFTAIHHRPPKHYTISPGSHYYRICLGAPRPHTSTFCYRTSGKVQTISPPSPLRMPSCPGIVISSSADSLPQTLPELRMKSSRGLMSPLLHTLHNFTSIYVHILCSMFAPVLCFIHSRRPSTKLNHQWLLQRNSAGTRNGECKPNDFLESVYCLLTPKPY